MFDCADNTRAPAENLREVTAILAAGVLRLHQRAALPPHEAAEILPDLSVPGLEVPAKTVLSVHTG